MLRKASVGGPDASDHALHGIGVGLVATQGVGAKLINKALDERHRAAIRRFEAAKDVAALRSIWREAMAAGDIPGAYWAALTPPNADQALVSDVFGDVHMLSHLVGGAKRLCRQLDRPFRPLRSTGAASLLAALREAPAATG